MMNFKRAVVATCVCLLGVSFAAHAQDAAPSVSALTVHVKPGMNQQFEEYLKAFVAAADKTSPKLEWLSAQSMTGGPVYVFNRAFGSWAELGAAGPDFVAAFGAPEAKRLAGLLQASVESVSTAIYRRRMDLSRPWPALEGVPDAVVHIFITVQGNMGPQFESFVGKVIEATAATAPNAYWLMDEPGAGATDYRVTVIAKSWSDLDKPDKPIPQRILEHFGQAEGQKLLAESNGAIEGIETRISRTRPDLGRQVD